MAFTERFSDFVCEGDCIACEQDGFRIVARICSPSATMRQIG